jgi:Ca2+-binding RTX toxin-like protein
MLTGFAGNDILTGGQGDDILTGGLGSDTFRYQSGDLKGVNLGDTINDFTLAKSGGDILDIHDLLEGAKGLSGTSGSSLGNLLSGGFLRVDSTLNAADGTTTVKLSIDMDGAGSDKAHKGEAVPLATLTMSGLDTSSGADTIIKQLLDNHELKL